MDMGCDCDDNDDERSSGAAYGLNTLEATDGGAVVISTAKKYQDSLGLEELRMGWRVDRAK